MMTVHKLSAGVDGGYSYLTRQAATRMAAICASVSACGWFFCLRSDEVPSTGLRAIASGAGRTRRAG